MTSARLWRLIFALIMLLVPALVRAEQGLVAHYTFDEGTGTVAGDSSGNNRSGSLINGTAWTNGTSGFAINLDGSDDYVNVPAFSWSGGGPVTVSFWNYASGSLHNAFAFGVGAGGSPNRFAVAAPWADGTLYWDYGNISANGRISCNYTPYMGKWTHITLVSAGVGGNFKAIYLNGQLAASGASSTGPSGTISPLFIGSCPEAPGLNMHSGFIDDFRIYNRMLPVQEILSLAQSPPVANPDIFGTPPNQTLSLVAPGVLLNDSDINGDTLTAVKDSDTGHGTLTLNSNGSFTYTPENGFAGNDSFTYHANDGQGNDSAVVTVTINVSDTPPGLVAWYTLSEGAGTMAGDSSDNNNNGTLVNGPMWSSGVQNGALTFDGTNDSVKIPRSASIDTTTALTVATWGKITNSRAGNHADLLRKAAAFTDGWVLRWSHMDGRLQFRYDHAPNAAIVARSPTSNASLLNNWHHFAATYNASTGTAVLYIDGAAVASGTGTPSTMTHTDDLYLMYVNYTQQAAVPGTLDDVRIYNRVLTAGEIQQLAQPNPTTTATANVTASFKTGAQNVTLTADVTADGAPVIEGTLTFQLKNGAANVGSAITANVTNGTASGTYALPAGTPLGVYIIQATYNGTPAFATSTDISKTLTVQLAPTTLTAANSTVGFSATDQFATLSASVTSSAGAVSEGSVTFQIKNGAANIGSSIAGNVSNGITSVSYTIPAGTPIATYSIEASYSGANFANSTDNTHALNIVTPGSMSALSATISYQTGSQAVTLNASVAGAAGSVNEGSVTFQIKNGAANVGAAATSPTVVNGSASATYTIPAGTPAGTYSIFASYSGGPGVPPSSDNTKTLTIIRTSSTTTPSNATAAYSFADQIAPLTAQITSPGGVVNEGTVTFQVKSGANNIGSAVTSGAITSGTAMANYIIPAGTVPGTYTIQASYSGGTNFNPSSDSTKTLTILKATPVITWPNPADTPYGTPLGAAQLNASVGGIPGTFTYNPPGNTLLAVGNAQLLSVTFTPADTVNYNSSQKSASLNVVKKPLTVTADNKNKLFGVANPALTASYSGFVNDETTAVLMGAPTLTTTATTSSPPGTYPITVTQSTLSAANYSFTLVNGTLTVSNTPAFFNLSAPTIEYGTVSTNISGKISFGVTGAVSITLNGVTKSATIDGTGVFAADFSTVSLDIGAYSIQYFYPGGGAVGPATDTKSLTVIKANPALTWANPADISYGTQLSNTQLNATANVAGTFAYTPAAGTVLQKGPHQLSVNFTSDDAVHYNNASASVTLVVGLAQATITWVTPADISYGTALSEAQLNATADITGAFVYSPPSGTILDSGDAQKLSLTFTPEDIVNYAISHVDVFINVLKADQSIAFAQIPDQEIGSPALTLEATASSNLAVTISLVSGNATLQGNVLSFNNLGAVTLRAEQAGDGNFNAAPTLEQTFHVIIIPPHLTSAFSASGTQGQAFTFTLTASGTQPLTFESGTLPAGLALNGGTGEISGTPTASGAFQIAVTARNGGGTETKTLTLVFASSGGGENHAPKFISGVLAAPNLAAVNQEVTFTVFASDEDGDAVAIVWDFGDGAQGFGSTAAHRYAAAGIFAAKATITDGAATDYLNLTIVVNNVVIPGDEYKLYVVSKLALKFNFAKPNVDSLSISGTIPIPPAFSPESEVVAFDSAELHRDWTLDKKATSADKAFKLTGKFAKDGTFSASPAKFALNLKNQALFMGLEPLGFVNDNTPKGMVVAMPVILTIENTAYLANVDVKYAAKKGKSGSGKK